MSLDALKKVHEELSKTYDVGDLGSFTTAMQDSSKRQAAYDAISKDYDVGDFASFSTAITSAVPVAAPVVSAAPAIAPTEEKGYDWSPKAVLKEIGAGAAEIDAGLLRSLSKTAHVIDVLGNGLNEKLGLPTNVVAPAMSWYLNKLADDIGSVGIKGEDAISKMSQRVNQGFGSGLGAVAIISFLGPEGLAIMGGAEAATEAIDAGDDPANVIAKAAMGAAQGKLFGLILHASNQLPLSGRIGVGSAAGALPAILAGDPQEAISQAVTMGILAMPGPRVSWKQTISELKGPVDNRPFSIEERAIYKPFMDAVTKQKPELAAAIKKLSPREQRDATRKLWNQAVEYTDIENQKLTQLEEIADREGIDIRYRSIEEAKLKGRNTTGMVQHADKEGKEIYRITAVADPFVVGHELGHIVARRSVVDLASLDVNELATIYKEGNKRLRDKFGKVVDKRFRSEFSDTPEKRLEATAEFISFYMNDPIAANRMAPGMTAAFSKEIDTFMTPPKKAATVPEVIEKMVADVARPIVTPEQQAILEKYNLKAEGVQIDPVAGEDTIQITNQVTGGSLYPYKNFTEKDLVDNLQKSLSQDWKDVPAETIQAERDRIADIYSKKYQQSYLSLVWNEEKKHFEFATSTGYGGVEYATGPATLNQQLFGLGRSRGIPPDVISKAIRLETGIDDFKFTGEGDNVVKREQLGELFNRLRNIKKHWTPLQKERFLIDGQLPMPDQHEAAKVAASRENPVGAAVRKINSDLARTISTTLEKMGLGGHTINEKRQTAEHEQQSKYAQAIGIIKRVYKSLSDEELKTIIRSANSGNVDGLSEKLRSRFDIINTPRVDVNETAKKAQFKVKNSEGKSVPYQGLSGTSWPHVFDFSEFKSAEKRESIIKNLMEKNKIEYADASARLDEFIDSRTKNPSSYLEYARESGVGGWLGDPDAVDKNGKPTWTRAKSLEGLERYYASVYKRLAEARHYDYNGKFFEGEPGLGKDHKTVADIIAEEKNPGNRALMIEAVNNIRGLNPMQMERPFLSMARNLNVVRLLGLYGVRNIFQLPVTMPSKAYTFGFARGHRIMWNGIVEAIRNPDFARYEVGAGLMQNLREVVSSSAGGGWTATAAKWALRTYGGSTETMNSIVAASMGKPFIKEAMAIINGAPPSGVIGRKFRNMRYERLQKIARGELEKFGVSKESIDSGHITDLEIAQASWRMAKMTQMGGGAADSPMLWSSEYGKTIFQFRRFSLGMSKLMYNEVAKPAMKGNFAPLIATLPAAILAGEVSTAVINLITGRSDRPENLIKRLVEDIASVGVFGAFSDAFQAASYGRIPETLVGPSVMYPVEILTQIMKWEIYELLRKQIPFIRSTKILKVDKTKKKGW